MCGLLRVILIYTSSIPIRMASFDACHGRTFAQVSSLLGPTATINTATIRFFTLPLKGFLDRGSLAHFVIFLIRLPVTVELS